MKGKRIEDKVKVNEEIAKNNLIEEFLTASEKTHYRGSTSTRRCLHSSYQEPCFEDKDYDPVGQLIKMYCNQEI